MKELEIVISAQPEEYTLCQFPLRNNGQQIMGGVHPIRLCYLLVHIIQCVSADSVCMCVCVCQEGV